MAVLVAARACEDACAGHEDEALEAALRRRRERVAVGGRDVECRADRRVIANGEAGVACVGR